MSRETACNIFSEEIVILYIIQKSGRLIETIDIHTVVLKTLILLLKNLKVIFYKSRFCFYGYGSLEIEMFR